MRCTSPQNYHLSNDVCESPENLYTEAAENFKHPKHVAAAYDIRDVPATFFKDVCTRKILWHKTEATRIIQ
jgi:hypothetical protein